MRFFSNCPSGLPNFFVSSEFKSRLAHIPSSPPSPFWTWIRGYLRVRKSEIGKLRSFLQFLVICSHRDSTSFPRRFSYRTFSLWFNIILNQFLRAFSLYHFLGLVFVGMFSIPSPCTDFFCPACVHFNSSFKYVFRLSHSSYRASDSLRNLPIFPISDWF